MAVTRRPMPKQIDRPSLAYFNQRGYELAGRQVKRTMMSCPRCHRQVHVLGSGEIAPHLAGGRKCKGVGLPSEPNTGG